MQQQTHSQVKVSCVSVTKCGNFGVLGYCSGAITKFNMQSGKERGVFALDGKKTMSGQSLHTAEITGLGVDILNRVLVSSSKDRTVKLWDFYRCKLLKTYTYDFPINNMCYNPTNDLVAFSAKDLSMTILNPQASLKRVRYFENAAENQINDVCFSQPESKWLLNCSMDGCIRVWDIVTGALVDWIKFKHAPLSLDFSPSGEFIATAHVNQKAVYLWSNKAFFQQVVI